MENIDFSLHVGNDVIVRDLGVILDCELSMKKHISKVTSVCYYHLRRLKTVRRILGEKTTANLVHQSTRLLQSYTGWAAEVEHRAIAMGAKRRRQADPCSGSA